MPKTNKPLEAKAPRAKPTNPYTALKAQFDELNAKHRSLATKYEGQLQTVARFGEYQRRVAAVLARVDYYLRVARVVLETAEQLVKAARGNWMARTVIPASVLDKLDGALDQLRHAYDTYKLVRSTLSNGGTVIAEVIGQTPDRLALSTIAGTAVPNPAS
jgi:hypothetical protein